VISFCFRKAWLRPVCVVCLVWFGCCGRQGYHIIKDPGLYGCDPASDEYRRALEDLRKEANFLFSLRHPNVIRCFGLFLDPASGNAQYLVLERAKSTLRAHLATIGRLTLFQLALLSRDVLKGLVYLHTMMPKGIAHRDIKDVNIFIVVVSDCEVAKLGDVDCSRFVNTRRQWSSVLGATFHMAPEVAQAKPCDCKIDMYSFGILLASTVMKYVPDSAGNIPSVNILRDYGVNGRSRLINDARGRLR
jgi:serine/threonine protein kinase